LINGKYSLADRAKHSPNPCLLLLENPIAFIQNRFYPAPDVLLQGMPQLLIFASGLQFSFHSLFFYPDEASTMKG